MRSFIFKASGLLFVLGFLVLPAVASDPPAASETDSDRRMSRLDRRTERYVKTWNKLIPSYSKIQVAGGMGLISLGIGWDYGRKNQWETDFFIGMIPEFSGEHASLTFTLKQNYIPWRVPLGGNWTLEPLETGLYINKLTSRNFWGREPEKYGGSYYKFATNTRFSIFLGQRLELGFGPRYPNRAVSLFYEISTNDLYLISAFSNRSLDLDDILVLSFGVKVRFL